MLLVSAVCSGVLQGKPQAVCRCSGAFCVMRAKCGCGCVGRAAFVISYCIQIPPCLPGRPGARGFVHSFLHESLGLRLSDSCVLCRNMVSKTILKRVGRAGSLASGLVRQRRKKNP